MGRICRVCANENRDEIDRSLVEGVALTSLRAVYGLTEDCLARHRDKHLPAALAKAQQAQGTARAGALLTEVRGLQLATMRALARAEEAGDFKTVLSAVREARNNLSLLAQMAVQVGQANSTADQFESSPEWIAMRSTILKALEAYPEAQMALAEVLRDEKPKG